MKILAAILFALLQITFPSKKLQTENELLRARIDSLQMVIDSLSMVSAAAEEAEDDEMAPVEYTHELTDSLLGNWYRTAQIDDYIWSVEDAVADTSFKSNVSDEEMIRRIEAINSFIKVPFNQTVRNYIVLYSEKMPDRMAKVLSKSQYYMPIFEETFAKYNLPQELKYMSIIESMLNPTAQSRVGARGMWQFMYSTARSYGLKINSFVDERFDVEKSVDAAARYLADAYKVFGDWNLAISSYNCGPGNVQKAIRRAGGRRDFWSIYPYLPRETRGYVPAFVGAMYAMTYYKECGLVPEPSTIPAAIDTFIITKNLHFKQINEVVGVPMENLRELNPQYVHDIVPGAEGAYVLKIPYNFSNAFIDADADSLYAYKSGELLSQQIIKNIQTSGSETRIAYKVKSGDYLGKIASRYGVSVKNLQRWNNLKGTNLRVGQTLYIYKNGAGPAPVSSSSKTSSKTGSSSSAAKTVDNGDYLTYTVQSGDSFYSIAQKYPGLSAQDIMKFNGISSSKLRPGMKIKIPKK